jgi:hypothetical protein
MAEESLEGITCNQTPSNQGAKKVMLALVPAFVFIAMIESWWIIVASRKVARDWNNPVSWLKLWSWLNDENEHNRIGSSFENARDENGLRLLIHAGAAFVLCGFTYPRPPQITLPRRAPH